MQKRRGASGHPCFTALCIWMGEVVQFGSGVLNLMWVPVSMFMTRDIKGEGKWRRRRARSMLDQGRVSYALEMS